MKKSLLGAAAFLSFGVFASADTAPTEKSVILHDIRNGQPMRFVYELEAKAWVFFLPVTAKASFDTLLNTNDYSITSKVKTTGLADILVNYDLTVSATGYVRPDHLKTYAYVSQNKDGKKDRRVEMTYDLPNQDFTMVATPRFGNLGDPAVNRQQALDANDPLTALMTFSLEQRSEDDPCGGPIKTFGGRELSHLILTYAGRKNVKSKAWRGEAIECHVQLDKVAGFKTGEAKADNISGIEGPIRMWLAPLENGATVPVRIEADTDDIGKVVLQASKLRFEPIPTD